MLQQMLAASQAGQADAARSLQAGGQAQQSGGNPLDYLGECVNGIHQLMVELPDPAHVQMASQALAILTKIQRDLMAQQGGAQGGPPGGFGG